MFANNPDKQCVRGDANEIKCNERYKYKYFHDSQIRSMICDRVINLINLDIIIVMNFINLIIYYHV